MSEVQTLGVYLDALYLNLNGEVDADVYEKLGEFKKNLHTDEERYRNLVKRVREDFRVAWRTGAPEELDEEERALLERSRETDFSRVEYGEIAGVPGGSLFIQARGAGRHYPFVLRNNCVYVEVTTRPNLPSVRVEWLSHALYRYGFSELSEMTQRIAEHFLASVRQVQVSRADVAADFQPPQGWHPPNMADVVTLAKQRVVHYDARAGCRCSFTTSARR